MFFHAKVPRHTDHYDFQADQQKSAGAVKSSNGGCGGRKEKKEVMVLADTLPIATIGLIGLTMGAEMYQSGMKLARRGRGGRGSKKLAESFGRIVARSATS